jgi:hypothetical protein
MKLSVLLQRGEASRANPATLDDSDSVASVALLYSDREKQHQPQYPFESLCADIEKNLA